MILVNTKLSFFITTHYRQKHLLKAQLQETYQ